MEQILCPWEAPQFLFYSLDSGIPQLLYYAYIPIILISLLFAFFVLIKDKYSLKSKLLLLISLLFTGFILNAIFQWTSNDPFFQMFSWQLNAILEVMISLSVICFIYEFLDIKTVSQKIYQFAALSLIPVILLLPTKYNVKQFYLTEDDCGGVLGNLWVYIYAIEIISIFVVIYLCYKKFKESKNDQMQKTQAIIIGIVSFILLSLFTLTNILGEITKIYDINLVGPIGMVIFLGSMAYVIVRFRAFNIKLIGAQALIVTIVALVGSQFFFIQTDTNRILTGITLIILGIVGINLIRSVKREVELREQKEKLAGELAVTNEKLKEVNQGQSSLIHFMNHQIKGRFGNIKNIFAELLTDDYGTMPPATTPLIQKGADEANVGINYVTSILKGASAESGTLQYEMKAMDLKTVVEEVVKKEKENAEKKGLKFNLDIISGDYNVSGDPVQLGEAIKNLIDNAINYTPSGSVEVGLSQTDKNILFKVTDTGVGITPEDRERLFKAGGRGIHSLKVNVNATGYGLVFVKNVVLAHKGRVWVESDGHEKGSIFYLELPKTQ